MSKILETIQACKKEDLSPKVALATMALLFHGMMHDNDQEIFNYCEDWSLEHGKITYSNLVKFAKNLGYVGEIVEIWMEQESKI
jgi:regulator of sigma D